MQVFVGLSLIATTALFAIAMLRDKPFEIWAAFAVESAGLAAIYNGIEDGNSRVGWFAFVIVAILAFLVPQVISRPEPPKSNDSSE